MHLFHGTWELMQVSIIKFHVLSKCDQSIASVLLLILLFLPVLKHLENILGVQQVDHQNATVGLVHTKSGFSKSHYTITAILKVLNGVYNNERNGRSAMDYMTLCGSVSLLICPSFHCCPCNLEILAEYITCLL